MLSTSAIGLPKNPVTDSLIVRWLFFCLMAVIFIWPNYGEWKMSGVPNLAPPRLIKVLLFGFLALQFMFSKIDFNRIGDRIAASWEEGWGLTPCEALLSGCAIVVSDNGGHREFAYDEKTALLFPIKQPELIVSQVLRLTENQGFRLSLAKQGREFLSQFSWDVAVSRLEEELKE